MVYGTAEGGVMFLRTELNNRMKARAFWMSARESMGLGAKVGLFLMTEMISGWGDESDGEGGRIFGGLRVLLGQGLRLR